MKPKNNNTKHIKTRLRNGLIMFVSGMLLSISAMAGNGKAPLITEAETASKTIREHVKFPNFSTYQAEEEKVNVVFTVDETGRVNLVVANTANLLLKKSIEEQFFTLSLKQLKANNAYSIQFNFKTL